MAPAPPPSTERVFATGVTESGKTRALVYLCLRRTPRALIIDATGDWLPGGGQYERGTRVAGTWAELLDELRRAAGRARWRIVVPVDVLDPVELADLLLARAGALTYARAIGGMALVIDELSTFAHNSCSQRVTALWTRGRHAGISIFGASQFPAQVARAVTSQSGWWLLYAMHEPVDVAYLARALPPAVMLAHSALAQYHAILWHTSRRAGYLLDPNYQVLRQLV